MIIHYIIEGVSKLLDIADIVEVIIFTVLQVLVFKWIPRITDSFIPREKRFLLRGNAWEFVVLCFSVHLFIHIFGWQTIIYYLQLDNIVFFIRWMSNVPCLGLCVILDHFEVNSVIQDVFGVLICAFGRVIESIVQNIEVYLALVLFVAVHALSVLFMWIFVKKQKLDISSIIAKKGEEKEKEKGEEKGEEKEKEKEKEKGNDSDKNVRNSLEALQEHGFLPDPYAALGAKNKVLKHQYVQVRMTYKYLSIVQGIVFFLFILFWESIELKEYVKMPLFLLLAELLFYYRLQFAYYDGYTEEEYWNKQSGGGGIEGCAGGNDALYKKLQEDVKQGVGAAWKSGWSRETQEKISQTTIRNKINKYIEDADYKVRCFGKEWLISKEHEYLEMQCMDAAIRLVYHESLYFGTKFYQNIGPYIFPFINLELLENKKILVLSGGEDKEEKLRQWMQQGLQKRYGHLGFWNIQSMRDGAGAADIGIMTMSQMAVMPDAEFIDCFMQDVSVVILHEPSVFMFSHPILMEQIVLRMGVTAKDMTYIVCDRDILGMTDLLEHSFKQRFVYVNMTQRGAGYFSVVDPTVDMSGNSSDRMKGICANQLSLLDMMTQKIPFKNIHWYMNYMLPAEDIRNSMNIHAAKSGNLFSDAPIVHYNCGSDSVREKEMISIVEDNLFNVCELLEVYGAQGYEESLCVAMSPDYLLRDFLIHSGQNQSYNTRILQFAPRFCSSVRNMAILIGHRLSREEMQVEELQRIVRYFDYEENLQSVIDELNSFYQNIPELRDFRIVCGNLEKSEERILVCSEKGKQQFKNWYDRNIANICISDASSTEKKEWKSILPGGHVCQYFLPRYAVALDGRNYSVDKIYSDRRGSGVELSRLSALPDKQKYYRQIRNYTVRNSCICPGETVEEEHYRLHVYIGDIQVITKGYIEGTDFPCKQNRKFVESPGMQTRIYRRKKYLLIQVGEEVCQNDEFRYGIYLKEVLFTLFPQHWQLLSVAKDNAKAEGILDEIKADNGKGNVRGIYVLEDSLMDMGLLDALQSHFGIVNAIICEYIEWAKGKSLHETRIVPVRTEGLAEWCRRITGRKVDML